MSEIEQRILNIIYRALKAYDAPSIVDISIDGDHKSSEIILTHAPDDGDQKDWVIRSRDITQAERDYDE